LLGDERFVFPNLGTSGFIEIKLARKIFVNAVMVAHADPLSLYKNGIHSAPRKITAFGVSASKRVLLAEFDFDPLDDNLVVVPVNNRLETDTIWWKIDSNWGNSLYTCIYRLAVYGNE
jgi:hypothetical protein